MHLIACHFVVSVYVHFALRGSSWFLDLAVSFDFATPHAFHI